MPLLAIIGVITIAFFILMICGTIARCFLLPQSNSRHSQDVDFQPLVPVCSHGIYALCFAEGYVILTESSAEAIAVCVDLELDLHPYWSEIVQYYPSRAEVSACINELRGCIGSAVNSFATVGQDGLSIQFRGYISTVKGG